MYIDFAKGQHRQHRQSDPVSPAGLITDTLRLDYTGSGNLIGIQASYRF